MGIVLRRGMFRTPPRIQEDFLLFEMGKVAKLAMETFGAKKISVELPTGRVVVSKPKIDSSSGFYERLESLILSAKRMSSQTTVSFDILASLILIIDGWTWNEFAFRAPIWMDDHRDIPISEAKKIEGLEWLSDSSSEIESRHNMEMVLSDG